MTPLDKLLAFLSVLMASLIYVSWTMDFMPFSFLIALVTMSGPSILSSFAITISTISLFAFLLLLLVVFRKRSANHRQEKFHDFHRDIF